MRQALTARAMSAFGLPAPRTPPPGLEEIKGLREDDMERLVEEGVDSAHALAFFPTPRLFFVTRYSLARICDWQDQALLIIRVGLDRARVFRDQLGIGGAIDAQALAARLRPTGAEANTATPNMMLAQDEWEDVRKLLGFATEIQAQTVLERLRDDAVVDRLRSHRAMIVGEDDGCAEAIGTDVGTVAKGGGPDSPNITTEDR